MLRMFNHRSRMIAHDGNQVMVNRHDSIILQRINSVNYTFEPLANFSRVITFEEDPLIRPYVGILS